MPRQPRKCHSPTIAATSICLISAVWLPVFVSSIFYCANRWWLTLGVNGWSFSIRPWSPGSIIYRLKRTPPRRNCRKSLNLQWRMMILRRKSLKMVTNSCGTICVWRRFIAIGAVCWKDTRNCWSTSPKGILSWWRFLGSHQTKKKDEGACGKRKGGDNTNLLNLDNKQELIRQKILFSIFF